MRSESNGDKGQSEDDVDNLNVPPSEKLQKYLRLQFFIPPVNFSLS